MPLDVNDYDLIAVFNQDLTAIDYYIMKYKNSKLEFLPPTTNGNIRASQVAAVKGTVTVDVFTQNMDGLDIGPSKKPNP